MRDPHLERILHAALALRRKWQPMTAAALARAAAPPAARQPAARARWRGSTASCSATASRRCATAAGWWPGASGAWWSARATPARCPTSRCRCRTPRTSRLTARAAQGRGRSPRRCWRGRLRGHRSRTAGGWSSACPEQAEAGERPARRACSISSARRSACPQMLEFYRGLGMVESDRVLEEDELTAVFLRSDPEHHSFAAFRAPESRARPPLLRDQRLARHPRLGRPHGRACASRCGGDPAATARATICSS